MGSEADIVCSMTHLQQKVLNRFGDRILGNWNMFRQISLSAVKSLQKPKFGRVRDYPAREDPLHGCTKLSTLYDILPF